MRPVARKPIWDQQMNHSAMINELRKVLDMTRALKLKLSLPGLLAVGLVASPISSLSQTFRLAALVVNQTIDWDGWDAVIDSFDSANPNWSTNGQYDPAKAKDNGDVMVGGSITDSVGIATVNIYGHVQVGVGGSIFVGSLGGVGERSWQAAHPGQIEPGWFAQSTIAIPPDVSFPYQSGLSPGPGDVVTTNCLNGSDCTVQTNHYDHVLYSGDYYATNLSGAAIVLGTARLVLPNGLDMYGNDEIVIYPGSCVSIFVGTNSTIGGNGIINASGFARNCEILGTPGVTNLTFNVNGSFVGVLVTPEAVVRLDGAGTHMNDFIGALVANSLNLNGNFGFHFDERLIAAQPLLDSPMWSNNNAFSFSVVGAPGFSYAVESSTNLTDWVSSGTNVSPYTFVDSSASNCLQRYYRAVRVP